MKREKYRRLTMIRIAITRLTDPRNNDPKDKRNPSGNIRYTNTDTGFRAKCR